MAQTGVEPLDREKSGAKVRLFYDMTKFFGKKMLHNLHMCDFFRTFALDLEVQNNKICLSATRK